MAIVMIDRSKYWQIVIYKNGKHHWISSKTTDKLEAQKKELEMLTILRQRVDEVRFADFIEKVSSHRPERKGVTVVDAWTKFLETPKADRKARTIASNRLYWNKFQEWLVAKHPEVEYVSEVNRDIAVEYCKHLKEATTASQTYNNHRNGLRGIFKGLMYHSCAKENPWDVTSTAAKDIKSNRAFSTEEITAILEACTPDWKFAVEVALYTGLRFIDVAYFRWDEVIYEKNYLKIKPKKTERFNKEILLPIHPRLLELLAGRPKNHEYIIPDIALNYGKKSVSEYFGKILDVCEISDEDGNVTFHSLRHTFITRLESAGVPRDVRQKFAGHGSPLMTDIYSHAIDPLREAINKI